MIDEAWNRQGAKAHWRDRQSDQPFFAVFNDMTTHQSRAGVWPHERFASEIQSQLDPERVPDTKSYESFPNSARTAARITHCKMNQTYGFRAILTLIETTMPESDLTYRRKH